jgi:two-component system response regulator YesN
MYDVCIADDEVLIQKSITSRLHNAGISVRVSGCADNAESAISLYWTTKPDIFFVDINMPGMDGLSLIRRIREEDPGCETKFIIITGYDDFKHMREAIQSGVVDYLKKPISSEEFSQVLSAVANAIRKERRKPRRAERKGFLYEDYCADFPAPLTGGTLLGVYGPDPATFNDGDAEIRRLITGSEDGDCLCLDFQNIDTVRLYYTAETVVSDRSLFRLYMSSVKNNGMFFVYAYPTGENLNMLTERIEQTMNLRFLRPGIEACLPRLTDSSADMGVLEYALEHGQSDSCRRALVGHLTRTMADKTLLPELSSLYRRIILLLINKYTTHHIPIPEQLKNALSLFALCRYPKPETLRAQLCGMITALAGAIGSEHRKRELIPSVCDYLKQNYMNSITLNDLANHFYVSPSYLSRRFKEKMRLTLVQFLEDIRMEKAQEYLADSEAQIFDISEQVGYLDPNYFAKVFKKKFHISPSDYRQQRK